MQIIGDSLAPGEAPPASAPSSPPHAEENGRTRPDPANGTQRIRTLIADDQVIASEMLRRMLKDEPDIEIIGAPTNGGEAVEAINRLQPDLVFLDVKMPGLDGFGVLKEIHCPRHPVIIFVTADEGFAMKAFEVHALDYLVKPCQPERFQTALRRARDQLRQSQTGEIHEKLNALLADLQLGVKPPERIAVKSNGRILFLRLNDVDWVEAADNYVILHNGQESHLLRETMTRLETKLPPDRFLRISRSTIVNVEQVKELHPLFHGEYVVVLHSGKRLTLTRTYREKLSQLGVS